MKRMKRRYKHMLIRSILLLLLFLAAVVAAFFVSHRETPGEAVVMEMEDAVLPVVEASVDGNYLNTMHGYTAEMVDRYMRDTVTPLPEDRKLPIRIIWKNDPVKKVRFEVRSLDTTQLVEDTAVDFQKSSDNRNDSGVIELELPIQNLLEKGKEYQLKIILQTGHFEQVAYYTRIVLSDSLPVGEMIRFIQNFHTKTLTAEKASGFAVYLKTNTDTTGSLGKVTLNSTYSQLLWNYLHPEQIGEGRISLTDINNTIGTFRMDSRVSFKGKDERSHLCDVQEIFTVQYTNGFWYVLDYERTVNEDLTEESVQGMQSRFCLGIAEDDSIHVMANSSGTCQAVVMDGELWINQVSKSGSDSLIRVFSYAQESDDRRADYKEHDIKLVSVEDDGDVSFILYGYMNRGIHEGEVGLLFYNYNSAENCLEEIFYLPFDRSYSILKEEIGRLTYVNSSGVFYLMLNGTIYAIDFAGREYMTVVENVSDDALVINSGSNVIAWEEKMTEGVERIQILYLESGHQNAVLAEEGEYLHAAGFVGEDLTVGRIRQSDCRKYSSETAYPMYALDIIGEDGSVVGQYQKNGVLITDTKVVNGSVVLERSMISGTSLQKIADDALIENVNQISAEEELLFVEKSQDEYRQWFMKIPKSENRNGIKKVIDISIGDSSYLKISLSGIAEDGMYFAYSKGKLQEICASIAEAVNLVYDDVGYVTDCNGNYVMRRGYRGYNLLKLPSTQKAQNQSESRYVCMSAFAAYEKGSYSESFSDMEAKNLTDAQMLQRGMKPFVYDLTGCSLSQIAYYYIGHNHPIYAMTEDGAVLIVGIGSENVYIWNPMTENTDTMSIEDAESMFRKAGNVFISCMDK